MTPTQLDRVAILTGSRAFGCETPTSDYDYVITELVADTFLENTDYKTCNPFEENDYIDYDHTIYGGYLVDIVRYTDVLGNSINLFIFCDPLTVKKFHKINEVMNLFREEIKDKEVRVKKWKLALQLVDINFYVHR